MQTGKGETTMPSSTKDLQFYELSHPWGAGVPLWPYFPDVKIERFHYHAKSGVLSQQITTFMHCTTHTDAPAHVVEGTPFMDEVPLEKFFGTAVIVSIPKKKWEKIMPEDLEKAQPRIEKDDIVIINTGWHKYWGDNQDYFGRSPGLYREAGEWFLARGVKAVGVDNQALDHPLATAIGPHGAGPLLPGICQEFERETGKKVKDVFSEWEPNHRLLLGNGIVGFENVGGDIDKVTGKRVTIAAFPWRWMKGDGSIVRMVAIVDPTGNYRL
jgi:kynurenine formamidase